MSGHRGAEETILGLGSGDLDLLDILVRALGEFKCSAQLFIRKIKFVKRKMEKLDEAQQI